MQPLPSTVFIVDDDDCFRSSVSRLLRASGISTKVYASAREFLNDRAADAPGCVVADLGMPAMNGIELQEALARSDNPVPIVFLTGQGDIPTSVIAMRRGAEDFLTKNAPREELLGAVQRALARDMSDRERRTRQGELQRRFDQLTPREREVLDHVLTGQLNKQIAADLGIDERSVKRHRTSLMRKLRTQSVAELSHLAHEAGMIPHSSLSEIRP
jgi:FixJ family two-component response regulator